VDVFHSNAVVETVVWLLVAVVPEPVPLRTDLRVEGPDVVVDAAGLLFDELLVEDLSTEEGAVVLRVEGPVE